MRLGLWARVNVVILHQLRLLRDAVDQKGDQRQLELGRNLPELRRERAGVAGTIIGWNLHARQDDLGARRLTQLHHLYQILTDVRHGQAAQAVIASQLQNHHGGLVRRQSCRQARQAAHRGLATHTRIHHFEWTVLRRQLVGQQGHPALCLLHAVARTQAVAKDQNHRLVGLRLQALQCPKAQHQEQQRAGKGLAQGMQDELGHDVLV